MHVRDDMRDLSKHGGKLFKKKYTYKKKKVNKINTIQQNPFVSQPCTPPEIQELKLKWTETSSWSIFFALERPDLSIKCSTALQDATESKLDH